MCMYVSAITHSEGTVQFPHEAHKLYAQLTEQITIWGTTVRQGQPATNTHTSTVNVRVEKNPSESTSVLGYSVTLCSKEEIRTTTLEATITPTVASLWHFHQILHKFNFYIMIKDS